jgi:hypothetical protein
VNRSGLKLRSWLPMFNHLDRRGAITGWSLVPDESEFHPAAAEQMSGLERMAKSKTASRNFNSSRRTIASRTFELNLLTADHGENVVSMLRNNPQGVARI